ncbi:MAG: 4-alpha-glucanotransferase [Pseudomonadales bacterium]
MSGPDADLGRLAALCGILPEYADIRGRRHRTSAATQRALLAAMGVDVASDSAIRAAIVEREQRGWRRLLPVVHVVQAGEQAAAVQLSVAEATAAAAWSFTIETDTHDAEPGVISGSVCPAELPVTAQRRIDGEPFRQVRWLLPPLPLGYHLLRLTRGETAVDCRLIVCPQSCYLPQALAEDGRCWGPVLQLFAVRSRRDWGIGDFSDLAAVVDVFAAAGAATVGLGPLHALYPHEPEHASPYSPSSRLFWNVWYIDVAAVPELSDCEAAQARLRDGRFRARLEAARERDMVDYAAMAALKREILELLFQQFLQRQRDGDSERGRRFRQFRSERGLPLYRHALFEALAEHFRAEDASAWGTPAWPEAYRHPEAPEVRDFATRADERVTYYAWLQWLAEEQLAAVGGRSAEHSLGVGLYFDLPLGADVGGSEVWAGDGLFAVGASIGAPPDAFNAQGQNWGLPPWVPERLEARGYRPFTELLRANMRHCGAVRIDHVMALMRLFWIPAGESAAQGAYVSYPLDDLLGIVALESQRNRCMVIGEDLGTVPDELRAALTRMGILSSRIFYFEQDAHGEYLQPARLPRQALVAVSNHDLPTLRGFWLGEDIRLREQLGMLQDEGERDAQLAQRARDRASVLTALAREGLLEQVEHAAADGVDLSEAVLLAVHRYLARSPAMVQAVQIEDVLGVTSQVNVPGTAFEHPNWRRKLPGYLDGWAADPRLRALVDVLRDERGGGR